jgi:hypothetical protein
VSEHDDWQAWQHQDELVRQERIGEILTAARQRRLTDDEVQFIAIEAGTTYTHNQT